MTLDASVQKSESTPLGKRKRPSDLDPLVTQIGVPSPDSLMEEKPSIRSSKKGTRRVPKKKSVNHAAELLSLIDEILEEHLYLPESSVVPGETVLDRALKYFEKSTMRILSSALDSLCDKIAAFSKNGQTEDFFKDCKSEDLVSFFKFLDTVISIEEHQSLKALNPSTNSAGDPSNLQKIEQCATRMSDGLRACVIKSLFMHLCVQHDSQHHTSSLTVLYHEKQFDNILAVAKHHLEDSILYYCLGTLSKKSEPLANAMKRSIHDLNRLFNTLRDFFTFNTLHSNLVISVL